MKRVHLLMSMVSISALSLFSCSNGNNSNKFVIDGTCSPEIPDSAYYVFVSDENFQFSQTPIDTIYVDEATKTFKWETSAYTEGRLINLQAVFKQSKQLGPYVDFFLCPGETAKLKVCNGFYELDGSKFYVDFHAMQDSINNRRNELMQLQQQYQEVVMQLQQNSDDSALVSTFMLVQGKLQSGAQDFQLFPRRYMASNPSSTGAVVVLGMMGYPLKDSVDVLNPEVMNGKCKNFFDFIINRQLKAEQAESDMDGALEATAEGQMFTDFEAEYNGKIQKLSDYVGKGKYVLVDFWASWCGPCRQEIPNIINVYNKYKGAKFDVIGVAVGDDPEDTKQAIADDKIPYNQILNTGDVAATAYGIRGIPHIILFGPDGTILKRDLRGPQIEEAVKEALGM
ncbi:MAG: TlpA family protein disulfide reductase [Bacteroidales bacterium]|nr:TlpA family protein disulfide reductase [Bacteroidales bacterium]